MAEYFETLLAQFNFWVAFGFLGQALFASRMAIQWITSERKRESVIPVAFWWLSLAGGATLLVYAIQRADPVFIMGQAFGFIVYVRNIYLIYWGGPRSDDDAAVL